jgi:ABC-type branched-subunit amino acid transport system substrate-binding protein
MARQTTLLVVLTASCLVAAACAKSGSGSGGSAANPGVDVSTHTITIGAPEALTGPNAAYGENYFGSKAYFDYTNAHGGINGWKINFQAVDDQYKPDLALTAAKQLVEQKQVFSLVAVGGTPPGKAILPYADKSKVPDIGMTMDTGFLQAEYPNSPALFGFQPPTAVLTAFAVQYAIQTLHAKSVGLFYTHDPTGDPGPPAATYEAKQLDPSAKVTSVALSSTATDFSGYVSRMAAAKPDVVISWNSPAVTIGLMKSAQSIGLRTTWFGPFYDPLPSFFSTLGSLADNMYFESWFEPFGESSAAMDQFVNATKQYTTDKNPSFLAELGWIGAGEFAHALDLATRGGKTPTRQSLTAALADGDSFSPGNLGVKVSFKPGSRIATSGADRILQWRNGQLQTLVTAADPTVPASVITASYGGS